jgi:hypothetical protein
MNDFEKNIEIMKDLKNRLDTVINKEETKSTVPDVDYRHPDPIKHKYISFAKSGVRIAAGVALCYSMFWYAGSLLILAEILGIVEEIV